jgi:hypothetical protein
MELYLRHAKGMNSHSIFMFLAVNLCILDRFDSKYDNSGTNLMDFFIIQGPFCCILLKLAGFDSSNAGSDARGTT